MRYPSVAKSTQPVNGGPTAMNSPAHAAAPGTGPRRQSGLRRAVGGLVLASILTGTGPAPTAATPPPASFDVRAVAVLQALDKVTARVSEMSVDTGDTVQFGTLTVLVRTCLQSPPIEPPESVAFLEITDTRPNGEQEQVFSGWMFASSPALSSLEHPVYDIWLAACAETIKPPQEPEVDSVLPIIPPRPPAHRP